MNMRINNSNKYLKGYKKRTVYSAKPVIILAMVFTLFSCDIGDFGDMNTNPAQVSELDPSLQFPIIQLSIAGERGQQWFTNVIYTKPIVQHISTPRLAGEVYQLNVPWAVRYWQTVYGQGNFGRVQNVQDMIVHLENRHEEGEEVANMLAAARILRAFVFHRATDLHGDAPYFEAGMGYHESIFTPKFDPQEEIYYDMLNELDEAVEQFDPGQLTIGSGDLFYQGDIDQWRKFANSFRLRLAMRLVEVDEAKARLEAEAAINATGGLMTSNDDITMIPHEDDGTASGLHTNDFGNTYRVDQNIFLSQTMVNWMLDHEDPRLRIYGAVQPNGWDTQPVITDPAQQLGRPNGYSSSEVQDHPSWTGDVNDYTRLHPRFFDVTLPTLLLRYAEVEFLLAEAAVRWGISPSDPQTHYNNGVRAAMEMMPHLGATSSDEITGTEIDDYIAANPLTGTNEEMYEQIHTQMWAALFTDGIEAFANFRRTRYPDLERAPVDSPDPHPTSDTGGEFPGRLPYPDREQILNSESYNEAIERQGPNTLETRVWWDVKELPPLP